MGRGNPSEDSSIALLKIGDSDLSVSGWLARSQEFYHENNYRIDYHVLAAIATLFNEPRFRVDDRTFKTLSTYKSYQKTLSPMSFWKLFIWLINKYSSVNTNLISNCIEFDPTP